MSRLLTVEFGSFCFYDALNEEGRLVRRAAVHRDPTWQERFDLAPRDQPPWRISRLPSRVIDTGIGHLWRRIDDAWFANAALDADHAAWLRSLHIRSSLAVPLIARGRRHGVLVVARVDDEPLFSDDDFATVQELGRRAGNALENARLYALAREGEQRVAAIADAVPQIVWTAAADGTIDWFNRRWFEYTGQTTALTKSSGWQLAHHPRELAELTRRWRAAIAQGQPFELTSRLRGSDGAYRWFLTRVVPQLDETERPTRWYGSMTNVDAERRATLQLAYFAELGERLTALPTLSATLDAVVESLVPNFADWATVELRNEGRVAVASARHRDDRPLGTRARDRTVIAAAAEAMANAKPVVAYGTGGDAGAWGFSSAVAVPLVVDDDVRGVLTLAMVEDAGAFSDSDLPFVQEIARRIAPALAKAEIYERERRIAQTFQSAVLPRRLPFLAGLRFDALYEPGAADSLVGGDWFDAFRLPDGRVVITIGDVQGSGLAAATAMAEARQGIRGAAAINPDPAILLDAADRILTDSIDDRFATAWVGIVDPIDFSLRYSSAGHPPPLLRGPDGLIRTLDGNDLPLGLAGPLSRRRETYATTVQRESVLLLYTDGLIESSRDALRDEAILAAALAETVGARLPPTAQELRDAVLGDDAAHDDVALLLVEFIEYLTDCGERGAQRWTFDATNEFEARQARHALADALRARGMFEENVVVAEIIVAELLANVVRHASGEVDVVLDQTAVMPVLHVLDRGHGFERNPRLPVDTYAENGRGLYIVSALAREFSINRAPNGGSHARVVLETRTPVLPAVAQTPR